MTKIYRVTGQSPKWQRISYDYVRTDAFVYGQSIPVEAEFYGDDTEEHLKAVVILEDHKPIAGCRIVFPKEGIGKIERVCVVREKQRCGIGAVLIAEAERWIAEFEIKHIIIESQDRAVGFYNKVGYVTTNADPENYGCHRPKRDDDAPPAMEVPFKAGFQTILVEKHLDA